MADSEETGETTVCDSCIMAIYDEDYGLFSDHMSDADIVMLASTLGADIADHLCDHRETDGEVQCACACNQGGG